MTHLYVRSRIALVAPVFLTRSQTEKRVCSLDRPDMSARYPTLADLSVRSQVSRLADGVAQEVLL
jgi:hypothetical protein